MNLNDFTKIQVGCKKWRDNERGEVRTLKVDGVAWESGRADACGF